MSTRKRQSHSGKGSGERSKKQFRFGVGGLPESVGPCAPAAWSFSGWEGFYTLGVVASASTRDDHDIVVVFLGSFMVLKCVSMPQTRDADEDVVILCKKGVCAGLYEHFHASLPANLVLRLFPGARRMHLDEEIGAP